MSKLSPTLLTPYGYSSGTCGYCSPSGQRSKGKTSSKYGMVTEQMTPQFYQILVDRGWRRSGDYLYHPDMARTCCPQYTIRLNTTLFKGNKKLRQVTNRFNRFLQTSKKPGESSSPPKLSESKNQFAGTGKEEQKGAQSVNDIGKGKGNGKAKGKASVPQQRDLIDDLHTFEIGYTSNEDELSHRFETQLVPARATKESFELYKAYQISVHKDEPDKVTMKGFDRFLCGSTLIETPIKYTKDVQDEIKNGRLPKHYGQYHLLYNVDSNLIGISVIDILPCCVSSVYFIWHPDWAWASLGKLSALYEISLSRRIKHAGVEEMNWVYMGYWIPDCQKMKYKSDYEPSELLDAGTNKFHLLDDKLESFLISHPTGYYPFSRIIKSMSVSPDPPSSSTTARKPELEQSEETASASDSEEEEAPSSWPNPSPPGFLNPDDIEDDTLEDVLILMGRNKFTGKGGKLVPISMLEFGNQRAMYNEIKQFVAAVGEDHMATSENGIEGKAVLYFG
ncbi:uncharacterized protein IL334_001690 [Kwoniella shivajii]|uniref:arginyltransferase n=1 Tax=Kwoniella shivajii TaxID=564305 RepID=A0ABZ1CSW1_9TREE|nr:hypothetical protein IL334_001690 [Kwoniella shivajii]